MHQNKHIESDYNLIWIFQSQKTAIFSSFWVKSKWNFQDRLALKFIILERKTFQTSWRYQKLALDVPYKLKHF